MSWFKMPVDEWYRPAVRRAKARVVWPWVLGRIARGGGVASDEDLDPWAMSEDLDGAVSESACADMLEGLKRVGALVETDGGWTTTDMSYFRVDTTAADRKRAERERKRAETAKMSESSGQNVTNVTRDNRDVTPVTRDGVTCHAVTDVTLRTDGHTDIRTDGQTDVPSSSRGGTTSPARETASEPPPPRLREVVNAFQAASPQRGVVLPPVTVTHLTELVREFDVQPVLDAIADASKADTRGGLSIAFVRRFLERSKQVVTPSGGMRAAKSPAGPRDPMLTWDEVVERTEREQAEQARKAAKK